MSEAKKDSTYSLITDDKSVYLGKLAFLFDAAVQVHILDKTTLNWCDACSTIQESTELMWIDGEDYIADPVAQELSEHGNIAVCHKCYELTKQELLQQGQ